LIIQISEYCGEQFSAGQNSAKITEIFKKLETNKFIILGDRLGDSWLSELQDQLAAAIWSL
jgi:hypothetical protein